MQDLHLTELYSKSFTDAMLALPHMLMILLFDKKIMKGSAIDHD